jgi:rhodanese-related sulfurtransferase
MTRPLHRRAALRGAPFLAAATLLAASPAEALLRFGSRLPDPCDPATTLDDVEAAIARQLGVPEITTAALAARLAAPSGRPVLFDVREAEEVAMGRIAGSIRLDPSLGAAAFLAAHGARIAGAEVVVYCSVGWRSGKLLERVAPRLASARPLSVANLRGGLFRWRAEGLPVEGMGVHPFDDAWGALLARTLSG